MRTEMLKEAGLACWALRATGGRDVTGEQGIPLPLRTGSHSLPGERGRRNEGRRLAQVTVRAGGRWRWAGLGAVRVGAAHQVPEEVPRAPGFEGGPSGSRLRAAARRPGFCRQKAPPKTW